MYTEKDKNKFDRIAITLLIGSIFMAHLIGYAIGEERSPGVGVTKITAGTGITLSPSSGKGNVTVNSTGGGGLPLPNGASNYFEHFDTAAVYNVPLTTWTVGGINTKIVTFGDGTTQVTAPSAVSAVTNPTNTITLSGFGLVFKSTTPNNINGGTWPSGVSTFNVTSIQLCANTIATITTTVGLGLSSEALTAISYPSIWASVGVSSATIDTNTVVGGSCNSPILINPPFVINAFRNLSMTYENVPTSVTAITSNIKLKIRGFYAP